MLINVGLSKVMYECGLENLVTHRLKIRGHPDMMSALEGKGSHGKTDAVQESA